MFMDREDAHVEEQKARFHTCYSYRKHKEVRPFDLRNLSLEVISLIGMRCVQPVI